MIEGEPTPRSDLLQRFQLDRSEIRGRFVRLGQTVDHVLRTHDYPDAVGEKLAELLVLAGALAGGLKFDGRFSLQVKSGGPIGLMVADCTNAGIMRGYASFDGARVEEALAEAADGDDEPEILGDGLLAMTVDQREAGGQVYQGIVELDGRSLVESMLGYFHKSEQVQTAIKLALDRDPDTGDWRAGAIVLQAMPTDRALSNVEEDRWREAMVLLETTTDRELVDPELEPNRLLYRLFHERGVRVFDPMKLEPGCTCDEERVTSVLASFEQPEIEGMKLADGSIEVTCQLCNRRYVLEKSKVDAMLAARNG